MDSILPKPEDHCRIQILVKPLGNFSALLFYRLIKALERRFTSVQVCSNVNPQRQILPKLVTELNLELTRFGEFQAFRKVFGLLCVGHFNGGSPLNGSSSSPDLNSPALSSATNALPHSQANSPSQNRVRRSSLAHLPPILTEKQQPKATDDEQNILEECNIAESKQFRLLKEQFSELKQSLKDQLVDSRCALFGFGCNSCNTAEFLSLPAAADDFSSLCDHLESVLHELLRSIYFVLESRRLDTSFERVETPPCPLLPDEEKYRMGLENVKSKAYRKKCIGRLRKKTGDYAFLTGLFEAAVQSYQSAIDLLKSTADLLWLAAAYEGWCCAAIMVKYKQRIASNKREEIDPRNGHQKSMHRVHTVMDAFTNPNQTHQSKASIGHQRYCSDEVAKIKMDNTVDVAIDEEWPPQSPSNEHPSHNLPGPPEDEIEPKNLSNRTSFFIGKNSSRRKAWRQLLNFDSSHSAQSAKISAKSEGLPLPSAMSSASRSSSAQNLASPPVPNPPIASHNQSPSTSNGISKSQSVLISRNELSERFRAALENYGRFSFVVYIEYECVMRAVHLLVIHRQFVEVESFLREHTCRFLDDKFLTFDNIMKSNICLAASEVYKMIGFRRKCSFFLRLAVFFRLFIENHSENDYKRVYPILNESLFGYGIGGKFANCIKEKVPKGEGCATFSLQIKAVHEVCTVAVRAGLHSMAIRHLCFMLESFFDHLDKAALLSLVEEMNKLTKVQADQLHVLSQPLALDSSPPVFLPPLQLTRIPALKDFRLLPLPSHLAPKIVDVSSLNSKIFIYSPFQERTKKDELCWVVDCASEVSVKVQNPLPVDLIVNNLALITEGCHFEHIPIRLTLPSCFGPCIGPTQSEVKLLGVPRSTGTLKILGYTCEALGCKNLCRFPPNVGHEPSRNNCHFSVRVLPPLPSLRIESSLQRLPTLSENPNDSIAELCVFTGQSYFHTITLCNSSNSVGIKQITIKIQQPQTCGGPMLFQIVSDDNSDSPNGLSSSTWQINGLNPGERKNMKIRVFGIDPTSTSFADNRSDRLGMAPNSSQIGQEQRVFIRRPISASSSPFAIVAESDPLPHAASSPSTMSSSVEGRKPRLSSAESAPLLERESSSEEHSTDRHDLIPYVGRLLSAEFSFSYSADLEMSPVEEEFVRFAKLPMAVTIVPAVNVSSWNVSAGDNPFSRLIVVDVANETDLDAELTFGAKNRTLTVQSKEICRVPLFCPCFGGIPSAAFQRAAKQASHMMQMQEIERLRRKMENHLAKHLEIRWSITRLRLDGQVPIGSLLSSVSFLRQLVLPSLTIDMFIGDKKCMTENILVGLGVFVSIRVIVYCSLDANLIGELSLSCYQNQKENSTVLNRDNIMLICGDDCVPFRVTSNDCGRDSEGTKGESAEERSGREEKREGNTKRQTADDKCQSDEVPSAMEQQRMRKFETEFHAAFSHEGIFKVRPVLAKLKFADGEGNAGRGLCQIPGEEDIFLPTLSLDVMRK